MRSIAEIDTALTKLTGDIIKIEGNLAQFAYNQGQIAGDVMNRLSALEQSPKAPEPESKACECLKCGGTYDELSGLTPFMNLAKELAKNLQLGARFLELESGYRQSQRKALNTLAARVDAIDASKAKRGDR